MKYLVLAAGFTIALGMLQAIVPAAAQSNNVQQLCNNKYGLGKNWANASEAQRTAAAAKINACIRSGGKS
jgi:hypothetical protein